MKVLRKFGDAIVDELAKRTATTLIAGLGVVVAAAWLLILVTPWYVSALIALVVVVIVATFVRIFLRRLFVIYPRHKGGFEVLVKHFTYRLEPRNGKWNVIYRRSYKIRALKDLDNIREPYLWTGTDNAKPKVTSGSIDVLRVSEETIWKVAELKFHDTVKKGQEVEFSLEWRLDDTDGKSRPFFSAPINEYTRLLKFDLFLPEELGINSITLEQRRSIDTLTPFDTRKLAVADGHVSWEIKNPPKYYYYCLRWRPGSSRPNPV